MDAVIRSECGDKRFPKIAERRFGRGAGILLRHHHADRTFLGKDDLAVVDFIVLPAESIDAKGRAMDAQWRLLVHLHLGENVAGRRIPSRKLNAGSLANQTAATIAADEIACPELGSIVTARLLPPRFCFDASDEQLVVNKAVEEVVPFLG
jgi:hypothetical protein